ncbi:MAG: hypothetical protein IPK26_21080 [Planctomycetes bacterium]|nr:hypothetical protein [Planctomycetota bacterium]
MAQAAIETDLPVVQWSKPWPGAGQVTRMVAGEFTGDHRIHAVVLDAGVLRALYSVAFMDQIVAIPGNANDIATVRGVGEQRWDRLAVVGATGLQIAGVACGVQSVSVAEGPWIGARRVLSAGDVDNGVLVGIAAASNVLLAASVVGGNYVGTVSRTFSHPIDDYVLADWTGDLVDDVVVLANDRLVVLNLALGELLDVPAGESDGAMLATLPVNTVAERVALVRRNAADQWEVVVMGDGISVAPKPLGFVPRGIAGGDFNGDRRPDLCLSVLGQNDVVVLLQRLSANAPFQPENSLMTKWLEMHETALVSSTPLFVDIDRDERCDVIATAHSFQSGTVITQRSGYDLAPPDDTTAHLVFGDLVRTGDAGECVLQLDLNPDKYDATVYNTAEVVLWRYEGGTGLAMAGARTRFDLTAVQPGQRAWLEVRLPGGAQFQSDTWNGYQVWLEVRVAKRAPGTAATGALLTVGPTWVLAATQGPGLPNSSGTTTVLWNGSGSPPAQVAGLSPFASTIHGVREAGSAVLLFRGRTLFGGAIRPKKMRAFAATTSPNPGPITLGTTIPR